MNGDSVHGRLAHVPALLLHTRNVTAIASCACSATGLCVREMLPVADMERRDCISHQRCYTRAANYALGLHCARRIGFALQRDARMQPSTDAPFRRVGIARVHHALDSHL